MNVVNKFKKMEGWADKISAMVKGPSWLPGRPWTGADEDKIDVSVDGNEQHKLYTKKQQTIQTNSAI